MFPSLYVKFISMVIRVQVGVWVRPNNCKGVIITVRAGHHLYSVKMAVRTRIHSDDSLVLSNNNCQEVEMTPVKTAKPAPAPAPAAISKPKISLQQVGGLQ